MDQKKFHHQHAKHLLALVALLWVSLVSGSIGFFSQSPSGKATQGNFISESAENGYESIQYSTQNDVFLKNEYGKKNGKKYLNTEQNKDSDSQKNNSKVYNSVYNQKEEESIQKISVMLTADEKDFSTDIEDGSTGYDLMQKLADEGKITFSGKNFGQGLGFFVEEINGKKEDRKNGWYWIYSVNEKKATMGISSYILLPGDILSWSYEQEHR